MLYKNTFKLMFSNASLIWKLFLYFVITFAFILGLAFVVGLPIYRVLVAEGFFVSISETYSEFITSLNLISLFENISQLFTNFMDIIINNFSNLVIYIVLFMFVLVVLGNMLTNFHKLPTSNILNMYMSSNVKQGFMQSFLATTRQNIKYNLLYLVTLMPINLGITFLVFQSFKLFKSTGLLLVFAPFIIIIGFTIINSLKTAFFCGWVPSIVTQNKGVCKAFRNGFVVTKRRFLQTFGNAFVLNVTMIFINVFGGLCTFGVALLFTIPATFLISSIFNMVAYYTAIGQRFYVDPHNVIAPKTMELTEKMRNQRFMV